MFRELSWADPDGETVVYYDTEIGLPSGNSDGDDFQVPRPMIETFEDHHDGFCGICELAKLNGGLIE